MKNGLIIALSRKCNRFVIDRDQNDYTRFFQEFPVNDDCL